MRQKVRRRSPNTGSIRASGSRRISPVNSRSKRSCPEGFRKTFPSILDGLYRLFTTYGANLVEINPLVLTRDGAVYASDAKLELDDNALFKHPELLQWNADTSPDADEEAALAIGLGRSNYAKLTGSVGVIANGAGLGMGTMDAIKNAGGSAANFLDIGGGAKAELVKNSYSLVVSDPNVKAMFINIFGGITRGDQVALGIVEALKGDDVRGRFRSWYGLPARTSAKGERF